MLVAMLNELLAFLCHICLIVSSKDSRLAKDPEGSTKEYSSNCTIDLDHDDDSLTRRSSGSPVKQRRGVLQLSSSAPDIPPPQRPAVVHLPAPCCQ
jgi:hypothetical protein